MDILNNPFFILGASVFDPQSKLNALAQQKIKSLDPKLVQNALHTLLDPRQRLQAELSWVYNFSYSVLNPQLQQRLSEFQKSLGRKEFLPYSNVDPLKFLPSYPCPHQELKRIANPIWAACKELYMIAPNGLGALSAVNLLLLLFKFHWKPSNLEPAKNKPADMVVTIVHAYDDINLGALGDLINQTRQQAGFPPISMDDLKTAFDAHRRHVIQVLFEFFDELPSAALPEYISNLELAITHNYRTNLHSFLLSDLMRMYEMHTADFFNSQRLNLRQSLNYWAAAENDQLPENQVLYYVSACVQQTKAWLKVVKPLNIFVKILAQPKLIQAQSIVNPAEKQAFLQRVPLNHNRMYELFNLLKDYMSYVPKLSSESMRHNVLEGFKDLFAGEKQFVAAFKDIEKGITSLEHEELKELQAGLESPELCNFAVQASLPDGVDPEDNRVILTAKTIEFQQQLLSIKRILSYHVDKEDDKWVVYVQFESSTKWRLPFDECLTAFVFVHHLSMALLEYKFSVWMSRLRHHVPVTFAPVISYDPNPYKNGEIVSILNLWNDGLEILEVPAEGADAKTAKPKSTRHVWKNIDLKRSVTDMSWSMLKIYLKDQQDKPLCEVKYSVDNYRLLCCLFVAIQDNEGALITDFVKKNAANVSAVAAQNAILPNSSNVAAS